MRIPHNCSLNREMICEVADKAVAYRKEIGETESMPFCVLHVLDQKKIPRTAANQSAVTSELNERSRIKRALKKVAAFVPFSDEPVPLPDQPLLYSDSTPLGHRPGETYMRYARGD